MLERAEAGGGVERTEGVAGDLACILEVDVESVALAGLELGRGKRHADAAGADIAKVVEQGSPAAAEVDHSLARLEPQLLGHVRVLAPLRLLERQREVAVVLGAAEVGHVTETQPDHLVGQRVGEVDVVAVSHRPWTRHPSRPERTARSPRARTARATGGVAAVARHGDQPSASSPTERRAGSAPRRWIARRRPRSSAGNASRSPSRRAMYWAVHGPRPRIAPIAAHELVERRAAIEPKLAAIDSPSERPDRIRPRPGHPERRQIGAGQHVRWRERVGQAERLQARHRGPEPLDEPADDRVRAGDADLLADDRSDSRLVRVPGAGDSEAGSRPDQRSEHGIPRERPNRVVNGRVEREDPARALNDVNQALPVREVRPQQQLVVRRRARARAPRDLPRSRPSAGTPRR